MESYSKNRRPLMLWCIVTLYFVFIVFFVLFQISVHFDEKYHKAFSQLTIFDYMFQFYPLIILAIGITGLFMMRRWALYVLVIFMGSRILDVACTLWLGNVHGLPELAFILGILFPLLLPIPLLVYSIYAFKKGLLR